MKDPKPIPVEVARRYRRKPIVLASGCWVLPNIPQKSGYVRVNLYMGGGRCQSVFAHRLFYTAIVGPIPDGLTLDHIWPRCKNRACVRPKWDGDPDGHTEPVTEHENILRGNGRAALNARKTKCKHGHSLSGKNLSTAKDGERRCLACRREITRRHIAKIGRAKIRERGLASWRRRRLTVIEKQEAKK